MSSSSPTASPPFESPLSTEETMLMGNIAVLWGQIDEALNGLLRWALKLSPEVFDQLLGTQMTGKRVDHLRAISETCSRPAVQSLMIEIHQELKNVLPRRNAVMHGCWGYFVEDPSYKSLRPGTFNHQKPKVRFFADELPKLHDDLCAVLRLLSNILMYAVEEKPETTDFNQNKIYFAPSPPDERAFPRKFERGDKVIPVASQSRGWKERPAEPRFPGEASS